MTPARQQGFTLLEAIVAIVLVGSMGMAIFGWINNSLIALQRIRDNNAMQEAQLNILEYLNVVNPMLKPEGTAEFGTYSIAWKAKILVEKRDNVAYPRGGQGLYEVALYDNLIKVSHGEESWFEFQVKQIGYKRVRQPQLPF